MATNQELRQASVRAVTGTTRDYNSDWLALFDAKGIAAGTLNERMLRWINYHLDVTYTSLSDAKTALAIAYGAPRYNDLGTFLPGSNAGAIFGGEVQRLAIAASDDSMVIRDTVTPLNDYTGVPNSKLTTTRAGATATYWTSAGLLATASANTLRRDFNPLLSGGVGYLVEETRTNVVLQSRDLSNVAWTKTDCTALKDQVGIDGVTNSASSLEATGANATCLQAITLASSARFQTAFVKRITGSGVINMTMDNGSTWTAVTVTSAWTRVSIPTQTLANPTVGFRIVTSGDKIAIDYVQNENGIFASSPIAVTTVAVARPADVPQLTGSAFPISATENTLYAKYVSLTAVSGVRIPLQVYKASTANFDRIILYNSTTDRAFCAVGNVTQADFSAGTSAALTVTKMAGRFKANDFAASRNGAAVATDVSGTVASDMDSLSVGASSTSAQGFSGWVLEAAVLPRGVTNAELITRAT